MARADIAIATPNSATQRASQSDYLVKTSGGVIYALFVSQVDNVLYWIKSSDGGFSWTNPILVKNIGSAAAGWAVWYDAWTPGDAGTKIHIWTFDVNNDDVTWRTLDTASDTLSSEVVVFAGASTGVASITCISGTKSIGGNLYVLFDIDGGTETGFYRSVDAGANWTSRSNANEGTTNYYYIAPGFAADTQDILCIFWDRTSAEISRKVYDDSANSWAETIIATSMTSLTSATAAPQFAIAVDDANNVILLAAWSSADSANADLRFWTVDETTITEKTNVVLNGVDDQGMCAVGLATDTGTVYVYYGGKSDGSETAFTALNIYYKESTDSGTTWSAETQLSVLTKGYEYLMTFPVFTGDFGAMFMAQASTIDTLLYSALLPTGGGGGGNEMAAPIFGGAIVR